MLSAHGLTSFLGAGPSRRVSCGRCGDSFTGRTAEGRGWLEAHMVSEHETLEVEPARVALLGSPVSRTPQLAPSH